jgi:hypothetical protein
MVLQVLCETGFLGLSTLFWLWFTDIHRSTRKLFPVSLVKQDCIRLCTFYRIVAALIAGLYGRLFGHGVGETSIASCDAELPTDSFEI